jgi:hypothetical protein
MGGGIAAQVPLHFIKKWEMKKYILSRIFENCLQNFK